MDKNILRRNILTMLYERFCEHPYHVVTPKEFVETLKIDQHELNYNIVYLEEKGLVELYKPLEGAIFVASRITSRGIDLVEDELEFRSRFPIAQVDTGSDLASAVQQLHVLINQVKKTTKSEVSELLEGDIAELANHLAAKEVSYKMVQDLVNQIRKKEKWVANEVLAILKNPVIARSLADSAKRELLDS